MVRRVFPARKHEEGAGRCQDIEQRAEDDFGAAHDPADRLHGRVEHQGVARPYPQLNEAANELAMRDDWRARVVPTLHPAECGFPPPP